MNLESCEDTWIPFVFINAPYTIDLILHYSTVRVRTRTIFSVHCPDPCPLDYLVTYVSGRQTFGYGVKNRSDGVFPVTLNSCRTPMDQTWTRHVTTPLFDPRPMTRPQKVSPRFDTSLWVLTRGHTHT